MEGERERAADQPVEGGFIADLLLEPVQCAEDDREASAILAQFRQVFERRAAFERMGGHRRRDVTVPVQVAAQHLRLNLQVERYRNAVRAVPFVRPADALYD